MNYLIFKRFSYFLLLFILLSSCNNDNSELIEPINISINKEVKNTQVIHHENQGIHEHNYLARTDGFIEGFETASKGAYSPASISLSSGNWYLNDALLGTLSNDRKYGSKSIRIRNNGYAIMEFDMDNGAQSIAIRHAVYGNNGYSTWRLMASYDQGATWYYIGSEITTSSTLLNTATFLVDDTQSVRYGIYKTSNNSNRLNIDNIEIIVSVNNNNPTQDSNLTFGNPSGADTSNNNYFLSKGDFTLSYNNAKGTANWVSWHLSEAWTGDVERCNCFKSDRTLPSSFYKPTSSDYTNTGFDRGHICPSADRNGSEASNENTYYMSNIAPQAPNNNRGSWANFEAYLRTLILDGNEIHIISGVYGIGGTGSNGVANTIDNNQITVPDSFWKVALILPNGSSDISRVSTTTRIIAINIPNDQGVSTDWTNFITSVDAIENLTGYDLFENIPDSIESIIEANLDGGLNQ